MRGVRRHHRQAAGSTIGRRNRRWDLGEKPLRLAILCGLGDIGGFRVFQPHEGNCRADGIHRVRVLGEFADHAMQRGADFTLGSGFGLEGGKLLGIGQFAFPKQIRHFLKAAILGQILHRIAAIGQAIRLRHHLGDGGDIGIDADQALVDFGFRGFVHRVSSLACLLRVSANGADPAFLNHQFRRYRACCPAGRQPAAPHSAHSTHPPSASSDPAPLPGSGWTHGLR